MAHEGLWEQLDKLDGPQTAQRANCQYLSDPERYVVVLLNTEYTIDISDRKILSVIEQKTATFLEQLCLLAYLINAHDLPQTGKLVKAENLPGGQFFFRGLHSLPVDKLAKTFGNYSESIYRISDRFNAKRCEFGDASIKLYILPRIPLTIVIWESCKEFEARASILFDKSVTSQLPLDALMAAVNLTIDALITMNESNSTT